MTATPRELCALARRCFPWLIRAEADILAVLSAPGNHIAARREGGELVAACVWRGETIYLLCVEERFRGRGLGAALLAGAEAEMRAAGAGHAQVGVGESYIAPGVPMLGGADGFFRRRGYSHAWGETGCFDMERSLADLPEFPVRPGGERDGVLYRLAGPEDKPLVLDCVRDGCAQFAPYYEDDAHYAPLGRAPLLLAAADGLAVGCVLLDIGGVAPDLGNVGCTVTRRAYRGRGVATGMVQAATACLKEHGLRRAALQYTYTDILPMYARAGYRVSMEYFMARKEM